MLAALLGYGMNKVVEPRADRRLGLAHPVHCWLHHEVPFLFIIRRSLEETREFLARKHRPPLAEIFASLWQNIGIVLAGVLMVAMTTVSFYLLTVYTPTFGITVLHLSASDSLLVALAVGVSNAIWLPISGALSDRIGRWPVLIGFTVVTILSAYPAMSWLVADPTFVRMLIALLWLALMYGGYNGALYIALAEVMPVEVRTAGFSLAFALATALFGGFTPAAVTWLVKTLDNKAAPGLWMSGGAACGLIGCLIFVYLASKARRADGFIIALPEAKLS